MLFSIFGPACSGKDTIAKELKECKRILQHTTRPMRPGEVDGVDYVFHDNLDSSEERICFKEFTVASGDKWCYWFDVKDVVEAIESRDIYITITDFDGTINLFNKGAYAVMINVPVIDRLKRYYDRESQKDNPDYGEVIRRIIADNTDFDKRFDIRLFYTAMERFVKVNNGNDASIDAVVTEIINFIEKCKRK